MRGGGTLRDLGSHMAGLARYSPCTFGTSCNIGLDVALERISSNWTLLFEPGSRLAYSNTGFAILGQLLARHENSTYEALVAHLAAEMGLTATGTQPPADLSAVAFGYEPDGSLVPQMELGIADAAGGLYSSAADMAKLLSFLVRDGASRGPGQPLDSATVRSWLHTRVWQNPSVPPPGVWYTAWGVPWQVLTVNADGAARFGNFTRMYLISKDGSIPGYNAQMVLQPDLKLGLFAAMTTGAGGRAVPFFSDVLVELGLRIVPGMLEWLDAVPGTQLPPDPAAYVGEYAASGTGFVGRLTVGQGETSLVILSNTVGFPPNQPIAHVRDGTFEMVPLAEAACFTIEGGNNYAMHFARSAAGAVTSLTLEGIGEYPAVLQKVTASEMPSERSPSSGRGEGDVERM